MEGFEHLVKVALEADDFVVSSNLKFPVRIQIKKKTGREEKQTHGYEVDLVGARNDLLVLASVKSFFGSTGVKRNGFRELAKFDKPTTRQLREFDLYKLFNDKKIREGVIAEAAKRFRYSHRQVELRLYVGKFQNCEAKADIKTYLGKMQAGKGPVKVFDLGEILTKLLNVLEHKTYFNDPVVMTLKALAEGIRQSNQSKGKKMSFATAVTVLHRTLGVALDPLQCDPKRKKGWEILKGQPNAT
jgi:hypothetical protein